MKLFSVVLFLPLLAGAAILPDAIGPYQKTGTPQTPLANRAVWDEYGLKTAETVVYQASGKRFTASAYQLQDSTAALGAFDWQRNPAAKPSAAAPLASETADSLLVAHGNYLLSFSGYKPSAAELEAVFDNLRAVDSTGLPTLPGYLPADNLLPNSERYITGPVALQAFAPGIPPSVAAFHLSAEAQFAAYQSPKGPLGLTVFRYPTNQIAMQKIGEFEKLPGAVVKRSGPLVAVILSPADPDQAERLLSQVRYQAEITSDEYVPTRRDNVGNLIINVFILIGILGAGAIFAGFFVGGFRHILWRRKKGEVFDAMIVMNLDKL